MPTVVAHCQYHSDVAIPDKFSTCWRCVVEFLRNHGIPFDERYYVPLQSDDFEIVTWDDIVSE